MDLSRWTQWALVSDQVIRLSGYQVLVLAVVLVYAARSDTNAARSKGC